MNTTSTTNRNTYQIGTQLFTVELPTDLPTPPNMSLFLHEGPEKPHVNYTIRELPFEKAFIQDICTSFAPKNTIKREDRIILQKDNRECHEDGWYAHGWPICGSSEICHNESYPIEAIVMIHQAKENAIEPLRGLEPVKKLMAQITINMWNSEYLMKAMDLIERLAGEVPVFELGCLLCEGGGVRHQ